jgi:hypothetical protein
MKAPRNLIKRVPVSKNVVVDQNRLSCGALWIGDTQSLAQIVSRNFFAFLPASLFTHLRCTSRLYDCALTYTHVEGPLAATFCMRQIDHAACVVERLFAINKRWVRYDQIKATKDVFVFF